MAIKDLLSPQVISCIITLGMLMLTIRSVLLYSRHFSELQPRLLHMDREIEKRQEAMADQKKAVAELTRVITPLQEQEAALRSYYEELRGIEVEDEKRLLLQQQTSDAERKVRLSRKKIGID